MQDIGIRRVLSAWWPLASSWLLMSLELPLVSAVLARFPDATLHLAAYGGVVFPIAMIIEAPIIMLLAASTALCKDWDSFLKVRRFMVVTASGLTVLHVLVAATPLFDLVVGRWIGAPEEIRGLSRTGLLLMTPWTASIAYRRFHQGVLIRFGHSKAVGFGTLIRLAANASVLATGVLLGATSGIVVGAAAVAAGVVAEAVFVGIRVAPVLRNKVRLAPPVQQLLTLRRFLGFYTPLALTSLIFLLSMPLSAAALTRMPKSLESLAVWPVLSGFVFLFRCLGYAYNEVVVALLDEPGAAKVLSRFAMRLAGATSLLLLVVSLTPVGWIYFREVSGLPDDLARLGLSALWIGLPFPALSVYQSWYQGQLVHGRRTRAITESVVWALLATGCVLGFGVLWNRVAGAYFMFAAAGVGALVQNAWLRRSVRRGSSSPANPATEPVPVPVVQID